ncbi:MAG: hypothetical protein HXS41_05930 [Theionarchaea archaeon]|nr:hypothetical protein [Theionarchaea archaeon]MBU7001088.1 hypothetical protein [Theionarchaea archaeon]MBU7020577.1 hypothetical protein [Theionarchaea archaeon]MBU7034226.1 hypothetical protein [Theionarchaea archaeon]MBU7039300.1 hypothetical protein [Theionarchaea archaeon]
MSPLEVMIPSVRLPVTEEIFYDSVKDTYRNVKGMLALSQQFYFSALNAFKATAGSRDESMLRILADHSDLKNELREKLSLAGMTQIDIALEPGKVEIVYPKYDMRYEYRETGMYNTVYVENPVGNPKKILRIEKEGSTAPGIFSVGKKDSWFMKEWPEVLVYLDAKYFKKRLDALLDFFNIPGDWFEKAVSSL